MKPEQPALDKRKAFILATVVYEYINTAEPVGSVTLTQKYNLGVSSATIRNEMADLEASGFLVQPHTSAGRVPSDSGYRMYVDQLMPQESLRPEDQRRIREEFRDASRQLEGVIEQTTRLLGDLSRSLAFVIAPARETQTFRHIQLIWLSPRNGLAIIVTSLGHATQTVFELKADVKADDLTRLSNLLNVRFSGRLLSEVGDGDLAAAVKELNLADDVREAVLHAFDEAGDPSDPLIVAAGAQNLLDQPEFHDLRKLRSILRIVEEQKRLYDLIADAPAGEGPFVKIGHELGSDEIAECSLVTVPYRIHEHAFGLLAILGPRRMPYGRLMALAGTTAESLGAHLQDVELR
ncbi:MAG: heat-inducible transcription repressor HrcA, partial [Candidatus Eremiobacteraeota bacterium]|nr:heat-inducible transcription repressor HrcA [Candidatus Eremiobacteraeota bacterium]